MPGEAPVVVGVERGDDPPVLAGERDEVREVQLARRRRRPQVADPAPQPRRVDRVQARVDLGDLALLVGRVLVLDDPLDGPAVVAHDPAEAGGIDRVHGDEGDRRVVEAAQLQQRGQEVGLDERDVARHDEDLLDAVGEHREGRAPARRRCRAARPGASRRRAVRPRRGPPRSPASRRRRAACRSRPTPRRARTRSSAARTPGAAPWASPTSCACRARPRGRPRPSGARASRDLRGSRGRALARSRPDRRLWYGSAGARMGVGVGHQEWPGFCGRASGGVNRRRRARPPRRARAGSASA